MCNLITAFDRLIPPWERDTAIEVIELFERQALLDPRRPGVQHHEYLYLWLFESPTMIRRLPRLVLIYTINDEHGLIDLWSVRRL